MKVLVNARIYRYDPSEKRYFAHTAMAFENGRVVTLEAAQIGGGVERIDCNGATILPAFSDCHVHITDTGYIVGERDLSDTRSYEDFDRAIARLSPENGFIFASQYDESNWLDGKVADAAVLERHHPNARALVSRIDGHSCVVNKATWKWLDLPADVRGIERDADGARTGKLFLEANWRAQAQFLTSPPEAARRAAERRGVDLALSRGALHLHAQLVGFARDAYVDEIAALEGLSAKWYFKICEPDAQLARELKLPYIGGDVFLDGSIGSCTAAVSRPFLTGSPGVPPNGELRYSDEQLYDFFASAEALGISAGVHAIGDRAIEQCIATWERVLGGRPSPRGTRHFIEHFEIATQAHIDACVRMGIFLSMQPQFDALWGGKGGMYEARLGGQRMREMNALGRAQRAGVVLCGGDDSPVCALDPLAGMQAAVDHHQPEERLTPEEALTMYTYNAARLAHVEASTGRLAPGCAADFVLLDRDPLAGARFSDCAVLETWRDGERVFARA